MKKIHVCILGLSAAALAGSGCAQDPAHQAMVAAGDQFVNRTVGPEYERYVEKDATLTFDEKRVRQANVDAFRRALTANK